MAEIAPNNVDAKTPKTMTLTLSSKSPETAASGAADETVLTFPCDQPRMRNGRSYVRADVAPDAAAAFVPPTGFATLSVGGVRVLELKYARLAATVRSKYADACAALLGAPVDYRRLAPTLRRDEEYPGFTDAPDVVWAHVASASADGDTSVRPYEIRLRLVKTAPVPGQCTSDGDYHAYAVSRVVVIVPV